MQHSVVETWVFVFNKSFKSSQGSWGGRGVTVEMGQCKAPLELLQPVGVGDWGAQFGANRAECGVEGPNLWGEDSVGVSGDSTSPGTILPWGHRSAPCPGAEASGCPGHPQPYLAGPPCAREAPWWLQGGSTCCPCCPSVRWSPVEGAGPHAKGLTRQPRCLPRQGHHVPPCLHSPSWELPPPQPALGQRRQILPYKGPSPSQGQVPSLLRDSAPQGQKSPSSILWHSSTWVL